MRGVIGILHDPSFVYSSCARLSRKTKEATGDESESSLGFVLFVTESEGNQNLSKSEITFDTKVKTDLLLERVETGI